MTKSLVRHLYEELEKGNTKRALYIVDLLGNNINKLYKGKSLLCWAKNFDNQEVIKKLEEKRAVENELSSEEASLLTIELIRNAKKGDLEGVTELLEKGVDVDGTDDIGLTALEAASENGYFWIMEKLIEEGANINVCNETGRTYLMGAVESGYEDSVRCLIDASVDLNAQDERGYTALMIAIQEEEADIVKLLIKSGADVNKVNNRGETALDMAYCGFGGDGMSTLIYDAGGKRSIELNEKIPEKKVEKHREGYLTLMSASRLGNIDIVEKMIKADVDVNAQDKDGWTALMEASKKGNIEIIEMLISADADPLIKDKNGKTAIDKAKDSNTRAVIFNAIKLKNEKERHQKIKDKNLMEGGV